MDKKYTENCLNCIFNKTLLMKKIILFGFAVLFSFVSSSQETLKLDDIFKNGTYGSKGYGPIRWMKDNKGYSTLQRNNNVGGRDIIRYEAKSGKRSVLVSAKQLIPNGQSKPLPITNYEWSVDNSKL